MSREATERAIIGKAADLLSGPGGLASFLRTRQLGARLAGPSLPLDIGFSTAIPPGIRNAVILRDRKCRWPGGCHQPAAACQVHHVTHLAHGGATSLKDCVLLCSYHHQIVIHRWGWTLVAEPGRNHHRLEPRPHQGPVQPRAPRRVNHPAPHPLLDPGLVAQIERAASEHPRPPLVQRFRKVSRSRSAVAKAPGRY